MTTTVVNIRSLPRDPKEWPADHVYIGRAMRGYGLRQSAWANPYRVAEHGGRDAAVRLYEELIMASPALMARVPELKGKTLVCWCWPERCHGDVLARLANEGQA